MQSRAAVAVGILVVLIALATAHAQTFEVVHSFTGGADGGDPIGGLLIDVAGTIYGTTSASSQPCAQQCGSVFKLRNSGQNWVLTPLYKFKGAPDGAQPWAGVVFGPDGALYGTTQYGGATCPSDGFNEVGCGVVFRLAPPPTACTSAVCPWRETVLYTFLGNRTDGAFPLDRVTFDASGNLYGTTSSGGNFAGGPCVAGGGWCGTLFKLTHSNGGWTESVLYKFTGGDDGGNPIAGLTGDGNGNFYGVALLSSNDNGTVFELTPSGENTLIQLPSNASEPLGDLILDPAGNLYGTTSDSQFGGGASAFELMPSAGGWNLSLLHSFGGFLEEDGPSSGLIRDTAGNLYGMTHAMGSNFKGSVFKLSPTGSGWDYTELYSFSGGLDGEYPVGGLALDAQGNLYGTSEGGSYGWGVLWKITQ